MSEESRPPGGSTASIVGVEDSTKAPTQENGPESSVFVTYADSRRRLAYGVGAFAIAGIIAIALYSFWAIDKVLTQSVSEKLMVVHLVGHAAITIAVVFFCYQLLRASERLLLPYWMARDPEVAKVLLGIQDPVSTTMKTLEKGAELASKVVPKQ